MTQKEWAETCTPEQFIDEIIHRLTEANYQERIDILQALSDRANADKTGGIARGVAVLFSETRVLHGIGRPEKLEYYNKVLREAWEKARHQHPHDKLTDTEKQVIE